MPSIQVLQDIFVSVEFMLKNAKSHNTQISKTLRAIKDVILLQVIPAMNHGTQKNIYITNPR